MSEVVSKEKIKELIVEAIGKSKKRKFKQSVELILVLRDVDIKSPEGRIRETIFLPYKPNKDIKICVVAEGDMAIKAKEAGAYRVITRDDLKVLSENRKAAKKLARECEWVLVRTDLMGLAGRILGPALGPRGKIPVPVPINANIIALIETYKKAVYVRTKDQPQIMARIGTEDMDVEQLTENALAIISTISAKLKNPKYNIAKIVVKTTMGPAVEYKR
ncbi:MAG: 50S ribosomal protein L1 [Thermoprotei archaeon]|nr:MAG: 50S ribosomal protein L1 [Thermoprotei archaeon]